MVKLYKQSQAPLTQRAHAVKKNYMKCDFILLWVTKQQHLLGGLKSCNHRTVPLGANKNIPVISSWVCKAAQFMHCPVTLTAFCLKVLFNCWRHVSLCFIRVITKSLDVWDFGTNLQSKRMWQGQSGVVTCAKSL